MVAKSLDVVVLLKLFLTKERGTPARPSGIGADLSPPRLPNSVGYAQLSRELGISASEIHASVRRSVAAGLIAVGSKLPLRKPLQEFLLYGVRYAFPAREGPLARGIPTAHAAPPLAKHVTSDDLPPVWPDSKGTVKGHAVEPLHPSVPFAARLDPKLYELLALIDALRIGNAREQKLAEDELKKRLNHAHEP
jgi:hypothetical protein